MQDIKNSVGKLVCKVDAKERIVEIVHKGICTIIHMFDDGTYEVINSQVVNTI